MQTQRRSPSWGAWIEITHIRCRMALLKVAPPRGERGLKSCRIESECAARTRRSPSWGAWIEIALQISLSPTFSVAPPRGERGLKFQALQSFLLVWARVAPPRGERGLKFGSCRALCASLCRSPSWGAWIEIP